LYPHWSPDGSRIAFLSERDSSQDIWLMDPDGGNLLRLTNTPEREGYLVWSPDGNRLVFEVNESGNSDLYIINKDGSGLTRLIHSQGIADPDWVAGGSSLADPTCGAGWTRLKVLQYARVLGGGAPNRVRSEPKVAENQIGLLQPGAVAQIIQGPVCAGRLVFWKVMNDTIPGGEGWTAEGDGTEYWLEPYSQ